MTIETKAIKIPRKNSKKELSFFIDLKPIDINTGPINKKGKAIPKYFNPFESGVSIISDGFLFFNEFINVKIFKNYLGTDIRCDVYKKSFNIYKKKY